MMANKALYRSHLEQMIAEYPELFPAEIAGGYHFHDKRKSKKIDTVEIRRIKMKKADSSGKQAVYSIQPSFVMPYMTGLTDEVEKALFLMQYAVPFSALTYLFGHNDSYWYRMANQFGRYGLVQTTIQNPADLPEHLLADEKHSRINGEKCFATTTAGEDCILGISVTLKADEASLIEGYRSFQEEAVAFNPDYQPKTVNTDGWGATQRAWVALFPFITIIECFLHAFISIRSRCKKKQKEVWPQIQDWVWHIYEAETSLLFLADVATFQDWAKDHVTGTALKSIEKLCRKSNKFIQWYNHPDAQRTSNMIDRLMIPMDRWLANRRYFHGHLASAEKALRSWALLKNFTPYCPRAEVRKTASSPAHKLNGTVYHENWLHNLLVSTSNSPVYTFSHIKQQN